MKNKALKTLIIIAAFVIALTGVRHVDRRIAVLEVTPGDFLPEVPYSERDAFAKAIAMAYVTGSCDGLDEKSGTVNDILDRETPGIIAERYGIIRTDENDPSTAIVDVESYVRRFAGGHRYLTELRDEKSGFYGVSFADDENSCVWLTFSGAASFRDWVSCFGYGFRPVLIRQEKCAFALYETVLQTEEIQEKGYSLMISGHSLGGALSADVALASGLRAVTLNGADGLAYQKIPGILGKNLRDNNVYNYMTNPINGKMCMGDFVQCLVFYGPSGKLNLTVCRENGLTSETHCMFSIPAFPDGDILNPQLPEALLRTGKPY